MNNQTWINIIKFIDSSSYPKLTLTNKNIYNLAKIHNNINFNKTINRNQYGWKLYNEPNYVSCIQLEYLLKYKNHALGEDENHALLWACNNKDRKLVTTILKDAITHPSNENNEAFKLAYKNKDTNIMKMLLDHDNFDINETLYIWLSDDENSISKFNVIKLFESLDCDPDKYQHLLKKKKKYDRTVELLRENRSLSEIALEEDKENIKHMYEYNTLLKQFFKLIRLTITTVIERNWIMEYIKSWFR
jgi:hypothetical protein